MTKRERLVHMRCNWAMGTVDQTDLLEAVADYLLADDEPPRVDRTLRGWVLWTRTSEDDMRFVMWASDDGLCESPDSLIPMFSWAEFESRHEKLLALTAADLEAAE